MNRNHEGAPANYDWKTKDPCAAQQRQEVENRRKWEYEHQKLSRILKK
jgi:hypothetical protein